MKIVVGSDERTELTEAVIRYLEDRGHQIELVGPLRGEDLQWAEVGRRVAGKVAEGGAGTGVLFCWTGTGASMAANKVLGARAALCTDAETARGARRWNDANVLVMSLRLTSPTTASEMLDAWFSAEPDPSEAPNISSMEQGYQVEGSKDAGSAR